MSNVKPLKPALPDYIESGIPISVGSGRKRDPNSISSKLRMLATAPLGSSIFFPGAKTNSISHLVTTVARGALTSRAVEGGVRVWRVH